jgi:hypothetical protein
LRERERERENCASKDICVREGGKLSLQSTALKLSVRKRCVKLERWLNLGRDSGLGAMGKSLLKEGRRERRVREEGISMSLS